MLLFEVCTEMNLRTDSLLQRKGERRWTGSESLALSTDSVSNLISDCPWKHTPLGQDTTY
jgi:hypothetical protein